MPNSLVQSFADKHELPVARVEKLWNKAKEIAKKQYPKVEPDSDKYYQIVTGILKNMLDIKEEKSVLSVIRRVMNEETAYQKFFKSALKKFGVNSPDELSGEKEKEFYDYVDTNWKADDEKTKNEEFVVTEAKDSDWVVVDSKGKIVGKKFYKNEKAAEKAFEKLNKPSEYEYMKYSYYKEIFEETK